MSTEINANFVIEFLLVVTESEISVQQVDEENQSTS